MLVSYFAQHWWATFWVSALASGLAVAIALLAALASTVSRPLAIGLGIVAAGSQSFPLQAIAPLILITFGTGDWVKVGICFFVAFFPIFGGLQGAIATSQKEISAFLHVTNCASRLLRFRILFQDAWPAILSACKVGFTLAVLGAVVAEFILPTKGLGYVIVLNLSQMQTQYVLIAVGLLIVQGLTVYFVISLFERKALQLRGIL
jgi:NitT/TauT family transport system permease protein